MLSDNLINSSQKHLDYLISIGEITHLNYETGSFIERVTEEGVTGLYSGEIIGYAESLEKLMKLWKRSPEHNKVLLDKDWNWFGVSIIRYKELFISVVNFSTGLLGSVYMDTERDNIYIKGLYQKEPYFKLEKGINLIADNGEFEIEISANKRVFFIYVYDENGNLTDQLNIF